DLDPVLRVVDLARGIDQALRDVVLVVEGKLDRDRRELPERSRLLDLLVPVLQVVKDHHESARPEQKEDRERDEVGCDDEILHRRCSVRSCEQSVNYHPETVSFRMSSASLSIAAETAVARPAGPPLTS